MATHNTTLVVEPNVDELSDVLAGKAELTDLSRCLAEADLIVILVDHKEFGSLGTQRLASKVVIDTRGELFRE